MPAPTAANVRDGMAVPSPIKDVTSPLAEKPSPTADALSNGSAGLAVHPVAAAARTELLELHAVGVVAAVLARDVVALLALRAGKGDLGPDVGGLGGHGVASLRVCLFVWFGQA